MSRAVQTATSISKYNYCHPNIHLTNALQEKDHDPIYSRLKGQGRYPKREIFGGADITAVFPAITVQKGEKAATTL